MRGPLRPGRLSGRGLRRAAGLDARPGRRPATGFLGALHAAAALLGLPALADKGYTGAGIGIHTPAKGARLAPSTSTRNRLLTRLRAEGERGIALLQTRWKALRHVRLCPQRIGAIAAAALV